MSELEYSEQVTEMLTEMGQREEIVAHHRAPFEALGFFKAKEKDGDILPTIKEGQSPITVKKAPPILKAFAANNRLNAPDYIVTFDRYTFDNCSDVERKFYIHNALVAIDPVAKVNGDIQYKIRKPDYAFFKLSALYFATDEIKDLKDSLARAAQQTANAVTTFSPPRVCIRDFVSVHCDAAPTGRRRAVSDEVIDDQEEV